MTLKGKLFLTTSLAILVLVGVSEWVSYRQTAAFLKTHEISMRQSGASDIPLRTLEHEKHALFVRLTVLRLLNAVATVAALIFVLNLLWYRLVVSPIRVLLQHIGWMSRGTWAQRIPVSRRDEIGQLTRAFNDLGEQLTSTVHQFAAASKLSAMALIGQRIVRRIEVAKGHLFAAANAIQVAKPIRCEAPEQVLHDLETALASLTEIQTQFEVEFYSQFKRHAHPASPVGQGGATHGEQSANPAA